MAPLCSRQSATESREGGTLNLLESDSRDRPAALLQRCIVSRSLRLDEPAKAERLPRDRELLADVVDDLEEAADRRPALVELPGRVQVPRAEAEGDDAARLTADALDQRFEPRLFGRVDERLNGDVVPLTSPRDERRDVPFGRVRGHSPARSRKELARSVLRLLHVRLVARVDLEDRARDRGRELPAEELGAEVVRVVQLDALRLAVRVVRPFARRRHEPLSLLAGRLREQLLEPEPE